MDNLPVRMLLVEDSPTDQKLIQLWLGRSNEIEVVHTVSDGGDALEWLDDGGWDGSSPRSPVVLLDLHLPRVSGFEVLRTIRASDKLADLPVIVMAGGIDKEEALELGANLVIAKPCDAEGFQQLVETVEQFASEQGL